MIKNLKQITVSTHIVHDVNENEIYYIGIGNAEEKVIINVGSKNFKKVDELLQKPITNTNDLPFGNNANNAYDDFVKPNFTENETNPQQTDTGETVPDSVANDNTTRGRGNRRTHN